MSEKKQAGYRFPSPFDVVIDSDTGNETDDQFALVYALLAPELFRVRAIMAAPFLHYRVNTPAEGMCLSALEIRRILKLMNREEIPVWDGCRQFMTADPQIHCDGADRLVELARQRSAENPLVIVAIAALTNVAAALRSCPEIEDRIVLVWLGGHSYREAPDEFNLMQDPVAAAIVFGSGIRKVIFPCRGMAEKLYLNNREVEERLVPGGALGEFLANRFRRMFNSQLTAESRLSIWDIAPFAWLIVPETVTMEEEEARSLCPQTITWQPGSGRKDLVCQELDRDRIFEDFFRRLDRFHRENPNVRPNDF